MSKTDDWADLGEGVRATLMVDHDDVVVGVIHEHPAASGDGALGGGRCHGFMPLAGRAEGQVWDVVAGDPDGPAPFDGLTLAPSSLCKACGHHGFLQGGRWVAA